MPHWVPRQFATFPKQQARAPGGQSSNASHHLSPATKCATISRRDVQEVALTRPDDDGVLIYLGFEHNLVALHDANSARLGRDLFSVEKIGRLLENLLRIIGFHAAASQGGAAVLRFAGLVFVSNAESDQPSIRKEALDALDKDSCQGGLTAFAADDVGLSWIAGEKRAPASAPKKRLDNFNTTPQELPLSTQPPQEPQPATAPRQEQPTSKIKKIAKLTTAVVLAAIAIVLCAFAFILTKQ